MGTKYFWNIHKMFYDPPGTPPELRCINCRYAAAGGGAVAGFAGAYGVAKTMPSNVFIGMSCVSVVIIGFATSAIALRMAAQDKHWNETRYVEYKAEVKARRAQNKEQMGNSA